MWDKDELLEEIRMDKEELEDMRASGADPEYIQMLRDQIKWAEDMLKRV